MIWRRDLSGTVRGSSIVGGSGALGLLPGRVAETLEESSRIFLITDDNVGRCWAGEILPMLSPACSEGDVLSIRPGEPSKSPQMITKCWDWLASRGAGRRDVVVALGGGVVGDLAGFAAATYLRGVSLWQIPTTLLSQVDSSVGGKNGIDLEAGKNLVGSFYQPGFVVIDPRTLSTLPEEEYLGGLGEVVKYALLHGEGLLGLLEENVERIRRREPQILGELVERCVTYKADVVEEDEFDQGGRAVLNLGHTTGHALEQTLGYGTISHGAAVALGLLVALALSERVLGLDRSVGQRVRALLDSLGLPVAMALPPVEAITKAASRDKKVVGGRTLFVCLAALGAPTWGVDVSDKDFAEALEVIRS